MRFPKECYQMQLAIAQRLPHLRPSQHKGLALWVYGTIMAHSACQNAVITALLTIGVWHNLRQYLREWLYDGQHKAAPCQTQLDVELCFAPLLRWLLSWWQGPRLALAVDPTNRKDEVVALVVSVLYRGCAIPIAWHILPANQEGAWQPHILRLLRLLGREMPPSMQVLVLADRGLWSPRLWKRIRDLGWHPLLRLQGAVTFQPLGERRRPVRELVPGPGYAWVGRGTAFKHGPIRRKGTLIVVWAEGEENPWVLLTDLAPRKVGVWWYGLRVWIELGFRALKGVGWQWQRSRRTDPDRVTRHWLVLAVATLWVMACGTRVEDAQRMGLPPERLQRPPAVAGAETPSKGRTVSVFRLGLTWLRQQLGRGRLWLRLWLLPEAWPQSPNLIIAYHDTS